MRTTSLSASRFPLAHGCFGAVRLSATQIQSYKSQIQRLIQTALEEFERADSLGQGAYTSPWEIVGVQDRCTALRRRDSGASTRAEYRLMGNVAGDYRDMMELMYAERSEELFEWMQFMYHQTLDAHVLQTIETATSDNAHHYMGVKWSVFQSSVLAGKADQLFIEYMTYRKDQRNRDVAIRVTLPIRLSEVDHSMDALKVRRLSSQTVQIMRPVYESKRSSTRMFLMVDNDFPSAPPANYVKTLMIMGQNLPVCVDSKRIRRRGLVAEKDWIPNGSRRSCTVCTRNFSAARGRHHCRLCGDVICRKCMLVRDTAEPVTAKTFKVAKTKFCVLCITKLRTPEVVDFTASAILSTSKSRSIEFAPREFDEASRGSEWSETESEGCRADFDFTDSARSSLSSLSEQQVVDSNDIQSFGLRLQGIAEKIEDAIVEESKSTTAKPANTVLFVPDDAATSKTAAKPAETVLFVPDETTDSDEFMMTIDTKDMMREPASLGSSPMPNPLSSSGVFDGGFVSPERCWSNPLSSIDQSLAEQEALLRQLVLATHGGQPATSSSRYDEYEYAA